MKNSENWKEIDKQEIKAQKWRQALKRITRNDSRIDLKIEDKTTVFQFWQHCMIHLL